MQPNGAGSVAGRILRPLGNLDIEATWWVSWVLVFLLVYAPAAGHGFIKDDFVWLSGSRVASFRDLLDVLHRENGFYRPVVSLTFTLNHWLFGLWPRAYGLTNVVLALGCAAAIAQLARRLDLTRNAAMLAAVVWLMNFHGVGGSILWISGRTALLVTLFSVASTAALLSRRIVLAASLLALALFSKEEAVLLPFVQSIWLALAGRRYDERGAVSPLWWLTIGLSLVAGYLLIRSTTNAMTPLTAPDYYRLSFAAGRVAMNALHYLDWTATFATAVALIGAAVLRAASSARVRWSVVARGLVWSVGTFGVTLFVPARSDLYVCLPSVGACLVAASLLESLWRSATVERRRRALCVAALLPVLLSPLYYARTQRMTRIADLSTQTIRDLDVHTSGLVDGSTVVVYDDTSQRKVTIRSAFGGLLRDAFLVTTGRHLTFEIRPREEDDDIADAACDGCRRVSLRYERGRLVPAD